VIRRLYLPSSGAAAFSPAFDAGWSDTSGADRLAAVWNRTGTSFILKNVAGPAFTPIVIQSKWVLARQYVSPPIITTGNSTLTHVLGTVRCGFEFVGGAATAIPTFFVVKVIDATGAVKKTYSHFTPGATAPGSIFPLLPTLRGRGFDSIITGATACAISALDRLVVEIGYTAYKYADTVSSYDATLEFGDSAGFDLTPFTAGNDARQGNPWIDVYLQGGTIPGGFTGAMIL